MSDAAPSLQLMDRDELQRRVRRTMLLCAGFAAGMLGLAYASVPLYDLFCRVTGFDGTPMFTTKEAASIGTRPMQVRFDVNVAPNLRWKFTTDTVQVTLKPGETQTINYLVQNVTDREIIGRASYNIEPKVAAQYFNKLQCFCETDTPLKPGEKREASVVFFLDPELEKDPDMKRIESITLSYTFFASKAGRVAAAGGQPATDRN
ncbi:MAG: cytochrome c oxidase assembly protein [Beijerinckiaceae bacterium]